MRLDIILFHLAHILSFFLFPTVTLVSLSTFLDIRDEDVSNLGGRWKIRDFCESRIYKKDIKRKEFSRIERTILQDVVRKVVVSG
jgi:hypothetical protein